MARIDVILYHLFALIPIVAVLVLADTKAIIQADGPIIHDVFSLQVRSAGGQNHQYDHKCTGVLVNSPRWWRSIRENVGSNVAIISGTCGRDIQSLVSDRANNLPPKAVFVNITEHPQTEFNVIAVDVFEAPATDRFEKATYALVLLANRRPGGMLIPRTTDDTAHRQLSYTKLFELHGGVAMVTTGTAIKDIYFDNRIFINRQSPMDERELAFQSLPALGQGTPMHILDQRGFNLFAILDEGTKFVTFQAMIDAVDNATPEFWQGKIGGNGAK